MAESMSVRAVLSAVDHGFTSTMNSARKTLGSLGSTVKSGIGFGILTGAGMAAFNAISNGARNLITEIDNSNKAWKTFEGNMQILGKTDAEIKKVKGTMQSYAEQTIYSSSDMASTYSQLAAVGVKSADKLVTGFGGLAAAAENPAQAMKTLSQQATQMAAKPTVAWQDFKLMLEQTPAGIAAVAKEMGMTTSELVTAIQDGEVATEDFFAAIEKVGNSKGFTDLATSYKTVGQAMDGLYETLGNKLGPAFDVLSTAAIGCLSGIIDKIGQIDAEGLADKVSAGLEKAQPYFEMAKSALSAFGSAVMTVGGFLVEHAGTISKVIPVVLALVAAYKAFKIVNAVVPAVAGFTNHISKLASGGISSLGGLGDSAAKAGKKSKQSGKDILSLKKGLNALMTGASIGLVALSLAVLAKSMVSLASLGTTAVAPLLTFGVVVGGLAAVFGTFGTKLQSSAAGIAVFGLAVSAMALAMAPIAESGKEGAIAMGVFGVVIAGLVIVFSVFGAALNAAIPGMLALGAAAFLVGAGMYLASDFISQLPPVIDALGQAAINAANAFSTAVTAICDGAATVVDAISGGIATVLDSLAGVISSIGTAALNAGIGFKLMADGVVEITSTPLADLSGSLGAVAIAIKQIAKSAKGMTKAASGMSTICGALAGIQGSAAAAGASFNAMAAMAQSAASRVSSALNKCASQAVSAGQRTGSGFSSGLQSGLSRAVGIARSAVSSVVGALKGGYSGAYAAGAAISRGFAAGINSCIGAAIAAVNKLAVLAAQAMMLKLMIHSPSKLTRKYGRYFGEGFELGILDMVKKAQNAAEKLVYIPDMSGLSPAYAYSGGLSSDYSYSRNAEYVIEVPLSVDGKEFARATATYTNDEIERRQSRQNRKRGIVPSLA